MSENATAWERHGREAETPLQIPAAGWKDIVWRLWEEIGRDRIMLIAAGVTYYLLLALVPGLTAFVSLYGLFTDPSSVADQVNLLWGIIPGGGIELIQEQLLRLTSEGGTTLGLTLLVSVAIAIWSSSAGIKALFDAMNVAYGEDEKRSFITLNLTALAFTLGAIVILALVLAVVIVIPTALTFVGFGTGAEWLIRIASYVLMAIVLGLGIGAVYRWGPSREQAKWRWLTPGVLFSVLLIAGVSVLFSWYAGNFGNYNATYGSLGALIGLLTWIWLSVTILIIGAELDSEIEHQTARDSTTGRPKPLGSRGATMADTLGKTASGRLLTDEKPGQQPTGNRPMTITPLGLIIPSVLALMWLGSTGNSKPHRRR